MPDMDGYLTECEILIGGEVWEMRDVDGDWLCEEVLPDGGDCPETAVVELHLHEEEFHATMALCEGCFEKLKERG